jgi:hypothetical protein
MASVGLHNLNVSPSDPAVSVQVVAEVCARYWLVYFGLNLSLIGSSYSPVAVSITSEETKADVSVLHAIAVDIFHA